MKSCSDCPSFMQDQQEILMKFNKATGAPMCGRFGHILGFEGQAPQDNEQLLLAFAKDCEGYGLQPTATPVRISARVATPDPTIIADGPTGDEVQSCHGCKNLVKHDVVYRDWNWPIPLCKAKGTLVFRPSKDCINCPWAAGGMPAENLFGVELIKEYRPGFVADKKAEINLVLNDGKLTEEPTAYVTDRPVEPEDAADGIRAWRMVECPYGTGKKIPIPIFDRNGFPPELQAKIPTTGDEHHPELYVDYDHLLWRFAVSTWQRRKTLLIQSIPGLGKTEFTYWLSWLMQIPWTRIFFTDSIEWDDVFGKVLFIANETRWQDGEFTAAARHPGILCVDEPNMARSEIVATLRTTTEKDPVIYLNAGISLNDKGELERHKLMVRLDRYCMPIWCSNPAYDARNIGTKELAAADVSRIAPVELGLPNRQIEEHIIRTTVHATEGYDVPDDVLAAVMKISDDLREASKPEQGTFPGTWGIRENIDVVGNLAWYNFEESYRMTKLNYFEPETAEYIIASFVRQHLPRGMK